MFHCWSSTAGHAELSPRDVLGSLASTELEIHAEPRLDADCYAAPPETAPTAPTAPSPTVPAGATAPTGVKEEENRVQVGRWEGVYIYMYIYIYIYVY